MVLRTAHQGQYQGQQFYGCPNFPDCEEKIHIIGEMTLCETPKQIVQNFFYHLTHQDNLLSILQYGLLSRNELEQNKIDVKKDISNKDVQKRRIKSDPIYKRSLHDYIPLFFNSRNPMLYTQKSIQNQIITLCYDTCLLSHKDVIFTDGNAASRDTKFYSKIENLNCLDWTRIFTQWWEMKMPPEYNEGKRIICAEVLVPFKIDVNLIKKIICRNLETKESVKKILSDKSSIDVSIDLEYYFPD